jgi:hypothetical protein
MTKHEQAFKDANEYVFTFFGDNVDATVVGSHVNFEWQKRYNFVLDKLEKRN